MATLSEQLFRRKAVVEMEAESGSETEQSELTRTIGLFQLTLFGVGATIGTGIFIVLSQAVPIAGPSVIFSFLIAAVVAGLTAVCYAELAGAVPVSGSSYSYAYATIGELPAMKAVGEVEDQGYDNDRDDDEQLGHISSPSGTGGVVREHLQ